MGHEITSIPLSLDIYFIDSTKWLAYQDCSQRSSHVDNLSISNDTSTLCFSGLHKHSSFSTRSTIIKLANSPPKVEFYRCYVQRLDRLSAKLVHFPQMVNMKSAVSFFQNSGPSQKVLYTFRRRCWGFICDCKDFWLDAGSNWGGHVTGLRLLVQ